MSAESQGIFDDALTGFPQHGNTELLRAAAVGHLGASRTVDELTRMYAAALESGNQEAAQRIAEELVPVRQAARIVAGGLPGGG